MQSVEVTGKTIDEAKKAAAKELGIDAKALKITVLEESKGLFGKAAVRILAEAGEEPAEPKAAKEKAETKPAKAKAERRPATKTKGEVAAEPEEQPIEITSRDLAAQSGEGEVAGPEATKVDAERLEALVKDLLDTADVEVKVKATAFQGRYVNVELDGKDAAFLIGKHGEVLNALQYLVNIIAGRKFQNGIRATLDGANYRKRREEALTGLAQNVADQVKKRGEEAVLDALPAFERRIVHKALADNSDVTTYSEGEEPNRRVVIAPAD